MNMLMNRIAALLLGLLICVPAAFGDDIEIYNNPEDNPLRPPMTVLVLDLNVLALCDVSLTGPANEANPDAPQVCLDLDNIVPLEDVLAGVLPDDETPAGFLTDQLSTLSATVLCDLTTSLGLASPSLPLGGLLGNLTCGTLAGLLGNPLIAGILNAALPGFVDQLVAGLINPLLTTVVGQLPTAVQGVLDTTFAGLLTLGQTNLISLLEAILNNLINSRVAIVVSHGDRSAADGSPASDCDFGDQAAIPTSRRETVNCSNGAYFLLGFTPLVDQGAVNALLTTVSNVLSNALDPVNIVNATRALLSASVTDPTMLLPPFQGKEVYVEIANYLTGGNVYNAPLDDWDGLTGLIGRDTTIESGSSYIQPDAQCDTVNVLNIQVTNAQRDDDSVDELRRLFPGAEQAGSFAFADVVAQAESPGIVDGFGNEISLNSHFVIQENLSSVAALASLGPNVTTYANYLGLLGLGQTVAELLKPVLSVDASLLTPSNTADLLSPGQLLEAAFFPGFRADEAQGPRWPGNLKKLELETDLVGNFSYVDARGDDAIDTDGRIREDALSYWTLPGLLAAEPGDGRNVTLGGAGQRIPGYQSGGGGDPGRINADGQRKLFFDRYDGSGAISLAALDADDADVRDELKLSLGTSDDTEAHRLLLYARGFEVGTSASPLDPTTTLGAREWLHGAVLHSRPVAINYGARSGYSQSNPDVRVLYGAADGFLRMVRNTTSSNSESGQEVWGFMPQTVMTQQSVLRDNQAGSVFPYGVGGAPTVVVRDRDSSGGVGDGVIDSGNSHDRVSAYFGLRRSGSSVYGLDLTDPDSPALLWHISPAGLSNGDGLLSGSSAWFGEMALTFSSPQAGRIQYTDGADLETASVVIFGAGYNGGRDAANARLGKDLARGSDGLVGQDDSAGNAIYMVDGETGELIWKATAGNFDPVTPYQSRTFSHPLMVDSFAADVTAVDSDGDGLIDRVYALDTGGRMWRADFPGTDRSDWTMTPLASVGRQDSANVTNDRRFFQAPDYVPFRDANGAYDAVVFASGDRSDPFNETTANYLYVYRDRAVNSGKTSSQILTTESDLTDHADFVDLTSACATATAGCGNSANDAIGWKLSLSGRGEKAMSQPLSTGGTVFFTTYVLPDPDSRECEPQEGSSRLYGVSLADSRPVVTEFDEDGDNDRRSTDGGRPGLAGQINSVSGVAISANTALLARPGDRYYPVYWRERRGDDESPP